MVFQQFNLFSHLTVLEKCTLAPIWVKKLSRKDAEEIAITYLHRIKIPEQALNTQVSSQEGGIDLHQRDTSRTASGNHQRAP